VVAGETNLPIAAHDRRHTESADREYLASNIAALMNKNAEKDPGLKPILVLHVEFVRHGVWSKTIRRYRVPQTSGREIRAPSDLIWAAMRSA
jgi:hypothetical protein